MTSWEQILRDVRTRLPEEDFRRWFGATAYASDSGDQITVWVPSEAIRRHIQNHYYETVQQAVDALGRMNTTVRFVVGGTDEDDEE
jgi:chromosomal replication initiation ATPase DnaA